MSNDREFAEIPLWGSIGMYSEIPRERKYKVEYYVRVHTKDAYERQRTDYYGPYEEKATAVGAESAIRKNKAEFDPLMIDANVVTVREDASHPCSCGDNLSR